MNLQGAAQSVRRVSCIFLLCALGACAADPWVMRQETPSLAETNSALASDQPPPNNTLPVRQISTRPLDAFDEIARDLLLSVETGQHIALQPFQPAGVPIPIAVAQSFNDSLARAITAVSGYTTVIVARDELPNLFAEAEEFGSPSASQKLLDSAHADILLIGNVTAVRGGVEISYKAFDSRTGHQLASTSPRFLKVDSSAPNGLTLDQVVASAADTLFKQAADLRTIELDGIRFQQSNMETALGSYLGRELTGRLVEKIGNQQALPSALLGADSRRKASSADDGGKPGSYLLSGTLWDFGTDIEVRITLNSKDRSASYGGRIRRDALPASLLPVEGAPAAVAQEVRTSEMGLRISSDRGPQPIYAAGDSARLVVQPAHSGYLYCFHQASAGAGGGITKLFPNPYQMTAWIDGRSRVEIPGDPAKFALRVAGPPGTEYVRCFVFDRDPVRLPQGWMLAADSLSAEGNSFGDLDKLIRTLPKSSVTAATLVMTIGPSR